MATPHQSIASANRFGRKPGRGVRPWLLIPMLICASVFLGSVVTAGLLWVHGPLPSDLAPDDPRGLALINQVRFLFITIAVPTLLATMLLGSLLFLQHPRIFARRRWWQAKATLLCLGVPLAHWLMSSQLRSVRAATLAGQPSPSEEWHLTLGFTLLVLGACTIFVLARLKPRLGQNEAKAQAGHASGRLMLGAMLLCSVILMSHCSPSRSSSTLGDGVLGGRVSGGGVSGVPCDFSLSLHVLGSDTPWEPTLYQSQYVVEPDRQLRVALGPGARSDYYPPLTCYVSHQAFLDLYRLIVRYRLTLEPTSPDAQQALRASKAKNVWNTWKVSNTHPQASNAKDTNATVYRVWITCQGQTYTYATTPSESPPTLMLVNQLVQLRKEVLPIPIGQNSAKGQGSRVVDKRH